MDLLLPANGDIFLLGPASDCAGDSAVARSTRHEPIFILESSVRGDALQCRSPIRRLRPNRRNPQALQASLSLLFDFYIRQSCTAVSRAFNAQAGCLNSALPRSYSISLSCHSKSAKLHVQCMQHQRVVGKSDPATCRGDGKVP